MKTLRTLLLTTALLVPVATYAQDPAPATAAPTPTATKTVEAPAAAPAKAPTPTAPVTPAAAPAPVSPPQPPVPTITAADAQNILVLLSSAQVPGKDVPESYRLMAILAQIARSAPPAK